MRASSITPPGESSVFGILSDELVPLDVRFFTSKPTLTVVTGVDIPVNVTSTA